MIFILGAPPEDTQLAPKKDGWSTVGGPDPIKFLLISLSIGVFVGLSIVSVFWLLGAEVSPLTRYENIPLGLAVLIALLPFHELSHVLCFPHFGLSKRTTVGFWPKKLAAYVHYRGSLSRIRYILIALSPLAILSVIPLIITLFKPDSSVLILAVSYINGLASGADILGVLLVLGQVPSNGMIRISGSRGYWRVPNRHRSPEEEDPIP